MTGPADASPQGQEQGQEQGHEQSHEQGPAPDEALAWLRLALLAWYDEHHRQLPWRASRDPYAIWVSEVMLQQTQVVTVLDYYARWMERFPTLEALAQAPLDEVLALWAGLGYYRRARYLHQGASYVVEALGGKLPQDAQGLRVLPGVGAYTAGAIASIAFDQEAALVDGNVERILSRLFAVEGDPKSGANQRRFWALAQALVRGPRPGDLNQAMMELGATLCTPKKPACLLCPARERCQAYAQGQVLAYPGKVKRKAPRQERMRVIVARAVSPDELGLEDAGLVLITQRPAQGLWAGLWEFLVQEASEQPWPSPQQAVLEWTGQTPWRLEGLGSLEHTLSHIQMTMDVFLAVVEAPSLLDAPPRQARWVSPGELAQIGLSAAQRKIAALALKAPGA